MHPLRDRVILWSESVKSLKQLGGTRLSPILHHDEKTRQAIRSGFWHFLAWSDPDPDPAKTWLLPYPTIPSSFPMLKHTLLPLGHRSPEVFGLVGSGFWINHPDSGFMAGSDVYNLLTTVREDQASNPIRIPQIFGVVGSGF
jgi:hypothetical protein